MVEVLDSGVQVEEFLRSSSPLERLLLTFLTPCGTVGLLNHIVAANRGDHLLVVNVNQARNFPDRGPVTPQLIGVYNFWDIVFTQQPHQEVPRGHGVAVPLQQDVEHKAVLVHRPPQPVPNSIHRRADLVQVPPGTPPGFPVTQGLREERAELDTPFAQRLVADSDAALVEQFLHVAVTQ